MKRTSLLANAGLAIALTGFLGSTVLAADAAANWTKHCAACHGKDGNTPIDPSYPKLGGQHRDYLERALLDYRNGQRKNAIMGAQAQAAVAALKASSQQAAAAEWSAAAACWAIVSSRALSIDSSGAAAQAQAQA